jgi:four helix bundle protein
MEKITSHKDLKVWQESMDLVIQIYKLAENFPKHEVYGLSSQIRRASISIPSNIAEGAGRKGGKEFTRFLYIALGSLSEIETQLEMSQRLNYINNNS